ncbi:GreA/GreB family elongation factor [Patulibacter sp. SYSU D01012]|uniref:GreA/GreB family elongation factor n=1 Tax=Patulibacter sp. SYSU D01012 TaxID=2817381 RepID=UPI001B30CCF0|nr:GreA/GreB family elongation factor [Patulibacter sp. SYSU D01012]
MTSSARALPITVTARNALTTELRELRAHADGAEDAAAGAARRRRIRELERALLHAVVEHPGDDGRPRAAVGTVVRTDDGRRFAEHTITLGEDRPGRDGAVCARSPLGRALLGRAPGEIVAVERADGRTRHLRVLAVRDAV